MSGLPPSRVVDPRFVWWEQTVLAHAAIVTAFPDTLMPASPGTIETVSKLGRPISTPWWTSNVAGGVIAPRSRR